MSRIRKAVVPAAGYGTRMYPASKALKKELFPIVDRDGLAKPIIQSVLEEALDAGVEEICLITQPGGETDFRDYFGGSLPQDLRDKVHARDWARDATKRLKDIASRITYVHQPTQEGFGHAVHCAKDWVAGEPFLLLLGDHLFLSDSDLSCASQLVAAFKKHEKSMLAVQRTDESQLHLFGTVRGEPVLDEADTYKIMNFGEKPDPVFASQNLRTPGLPENEYLCVFGQYVLQSAIFDALDYLVENDIRESGEIQLTSAFEIARERVEYYAYETKGLRCDTGVPEEYVRTMGRFYARTNP